MNHTIMNRREFGRFAQACAQAEIAILKFDIQSAEKYLKDIEDGWPEESCQKMFLNALFYILRNEKNDYYRALAMLSQVEYAIESDLKDTKEFDSNETKNLNMFLVKVLCAKANCLYYMERDEESLSAYKRCVTMAKSCCLRQRMGIYNPEEVKFKILSLEFMVQDSGLRAVEDLLTQCRFDEMRTILDSAIKQCGVDFLDHRVLTLAAISHLMSGSFRKGCRLIQIDYNYTPYCYETQFLYAVVNFYNKNDDARTESYSILQKIIDGTATSYCKIVYFRKKRMVKVAQKLMFDKKVSLRTWRKSRKSEMVKNCLRFVYSTTYILNP